MNCHDGRGWLFRACRLRPGLGFYLRFALKIEFDSGTNEVLEGGLVDLFAFVDVDGAAYIAFEAGVEEAGGVFEGCAFGEGQLDDALVGFSGADDACVREDGNASPLHFFDDFRIGFVDELAYFGEGFSSPVGEGFDPGVDEGGGGFWRC
jgi:hypothetical protein